jgi:hypothetical protein
LSHFGYLGKQVKSWVLLLSDFEITTFFIADLVSCITFKTKLFNNRVFTDPSSLNVHC